MRVKSLLLVVVLNIFLTLMVSVLFEYNNLHDRIATMEDTISECLVMAVDSATGSEEVFSDSYQNKTGKATYSVANTSGTGKTSNTLLVYDKSTGKCFYANTYLLAMYNTENEALPTESEYRSLATDDKYNTTAGVYKYLFGETGSEYTNSNLYWANKNSKTISAYNGWNLSAINDYDKIRTSRRPNDGSYNASGLTGEKTLELNNFKEFYDSIGKYIETKGVLKSRDGDFYNVVESKFPVLAQMGLELDDTFNSVNSTLTNDNFTSVTHLGKRRLTAGSVDKSIYYLTPYSLGVTYIPQSVMESTFVANLDTLVRLQRVAGSTDDAVDVESCMNDATGCMPTSVFAVGNDRSLNAELETDANAGTRTMKPHDSIVSQNAIVNDGLIEYDLSSIQTKIDYKVVNFYDKSNYATKEIANRVLGGVAGYTSDGTFRNMSADALKTETIDRLIASDTKKAYDSNWDADIDGNRVVARITVRMKCHIPYQSSILQWVSYATRDVYNENHFDIKLFNGFDGSIVEGLDGVYYQYTTYKVISR